MAFQNFTTVQVVVCSSCQGQGCHECGNFGVYGITQDKTIIFSLPSFLDIKKRSSKKIIYLIKRLLLFFAVVFLMTVLWKLISGL